MTKINLKSNGLITSQMGQDQDLSSPPTETRATLDMIPKQNVLDVKNVLTQVSIFSINRFKPLRFIQDIWTLALNDWP